MAKFIHCHAHSDASISDGLFSPKKWCEALEQKGYKAHGLTDHGSMANLMPFYKEAKSRGIVPLLGVEFYYVEEPSKKMSDNRRASHLILFAKNFEGWRNLCRLSYLSFTDGFYYKNRIGFDWLAKHKEGLVCLTACQGGILAQEIWKSFRGEDSIGLLNQYKRFKELFGDDFYVEFQAHRTINIAEDGSKFCSQELINKELYKLKNQDGFKHIVTNDCHYILPEHAIIQKKIKEMQWRGSSKTSSIASDSATVNKDHFCDSLWLKNGRQILDTFLRYHEYLPREFVVDGMRNTIEVFEKCKDFEFPKKKYLPLFPVDNFKKIKDSYELFALLVKKKFVDFLKSGRLRAPKEVYVKRFKKEFEVISKYKLHDYFLIVWDLIQFANRKGIYSGIGRGSAAGCLISYLLGIVKIDPIEYNLIFERFLNENRCELGELPDIDLDFESDRRSEIKDYIYEKYGKECVSEIGTYGRIKLKTAIIDFGKAFEVGNQAELLSITTKLDLDKEESQDVDAAAKSDERLMQLFRKNKDFYNTVKEINGQIKSQGVHPAGIIICSEPIKDITPLKTQVSSDGDDRIVTTQAEDKYLISAGFMKMDILGLKEYDVIRYCIDNAKPEGITFENYVEEIIGRERRQPDRRIWRMFQRGNTQCVFQFSSEGMQELLREIKPNCINDLIAANALYRPGCLENGWHIQYCDRKHGRERVSYVHSDVEESLKNTYGVCVAEDTLVTTSTGRKKIQDIEIGELVQTETGEFKEVLKLYDNGFRETVTIRASNGEELCCTPEHKILTQRGWIEAGSLCSDDFIKSFYIDDERMNSDCPHNLWSRVLSVVPSGEKRVYDLSIKDIHSFVAGGLVVHNCVFQEQFMQLIHKLGGISLTESDTIRSALGKKDKDKLGKFKDKFIEGASKKISEKEAMILWDQIEKASGYSFNASHAAAYSVLAYISQWFKIYYTPYFWAAQIDWDIRKNNLDDMILNRRAAIDMGVKFVTPHINRSKEHFYVDGNEVVWSLRSIKGVGEGAAKVIVHNQPYVSFEDFWNRVDKSKVKYNNIEALIMAGAMDDFGDRRDLLDQLVDLDNSRKKSGLKKRKKSYSDTDLMMAFYHSMGFFEKSIKLIRDFSPDVVFEKEFRERASKEVLKIGGMVSSIRKISTKNGDQMAFVTLIDLDELFEVTVFPSEWAKVSNKISVGSIVEICGVKSDYKGKENALEAKSFKFF
jgi:DNA-directed DNA polymerase III PolC